jgi:hypothetical protein
MANPTTAFGWVMPTATDLVTDLPADFAVFGQGVDTSMQYLLGGTTGQVLSKTSGTNMAFTWTTPTDQTPLTTKGDLFTFTTVDARLGIGTNNQVLTADSAEATGMKWATPAGGGGKVLQVVSATYSTQTSTGTNTYLDSGLTLAITPTLNTSKVLVLVMQPANCYINGTAVSNYIKLMRDSTDLTATTNAALFIGGATSAGLELNIYANFSYLDSPATTSSTTYKTQFKAGNAGTAQVQPNAALSSIILLEIGA